MHPKERGELTEAIVIARLIEYGYFVSLPFGDNQRYDLVVDDRVSLHRVQVRTARDGKSYGSIAFNTVSTHPLSGKKTGYAGQIEAFIAYHPPTRIFYWIPIGECAGSPFVMRISPARNNQKSGIRLAADYELRRNPNYTPHSAEGGS